MGAPFAIPDNVPPDRVVDFDFNHVPGAELDPHLAWKRLQDGPDLVWTPHYGGHWIVTRAEDVKLVQSDYEHFSHRIHTLPVDNHSGVHAAIQLVPNNLDPPEHGLYRSILNPFFSPKTIAGLHDEVRALTIALIEGFKAKGECEFIGDFAKQLPVTIFMRLAGMPLDRRETFMEWVEAVARSATHEETMAAIGNTLAYLKKELQSRTGKQGTDLFTYIANARVEGQPIAPEKALGLYFVVFFGGLDTVASMMGFIAAFLARHPGHRKQLVDNPAIIPDAVEEFLRRYGLSNTVRVLTKDIELKGVLLKKDDIIMVPISLSGMDERCYPNALEVDFSRKPLHNTFGNGPHRCVGSMLARTELRIFLEEWPKRIPDFWIKPGEQIKTGTGSINGVVRLPLAWKT